jgi:Protein of unknown function (DUF2809)
MKNLKYPILVLVIILLGILSRKISFIPLFVGDLLYATMIYFMVRIFSNRKDFLKSAIIAMLICFSIELLQFYKANWMIEIRKTTFGHYVLGQGFLWSDLVAYLVGTLIGFFLDRKCFKLM